MSSIINNGASCSKDGNTRYRPYSRFEQTSKSASTLKSVDNIDKKSDDQSTVVIDEGKRLLVGSVEQVVHWCNMLSFFNPTKIIYQVYGIMGAVKIGSHKCEKIFCLRSEYKLSRIVCVFYEIDRKMPSIHEGSLVLCTGHVKGKNKLQVFTLRELLPNENSSSFDRISMVSQWTVNDIVMYKKM